MTENQHDTARITDGCIHIYRGNGKGKTTAAVGAAVRALGAGLRVGFVSFLKDGTSSELTVLQAHPACTVFPCCAQVPFAFAMTAEERVRFAAYYDALLKDALAKSDQFDLLILDEVLDAFETELVDEAPLIAYIERGKHPELILTGRRAAPLFLAHADYVTTMNAERHPFETGQAARRGIEY